MRCAVARSMRRLGLAGQGVLALALLGPPPARGAEPSASDLQALKERVAQATRMLAREKLLESSGHVSARVPGTNRVLIGPADVSRDIVQAGDIITVDLDAKQIEGRTKAPLETEIHTGVYRARGDVMGVVHSHPLHSVVFSITRKPILPVSVHGAIFADGVPVFEHVGHVNTRELGDRLAAVLGRRRAALIKMHGAVVVGPGLEEAFVAALQLEENAEKQLWAEMTGKVEPMSAEEAERSVRQSFSAFSVAKRWQYYQDKEKTALGR
jgi:L-ribulose-5-phosphate 4-epimerase